MVLCRGGMGCVGVVGGWMSLVGFGWMSLVGFGWMSLVGVGWMSLVASMGWALGEG
ncbi:hypothetical protein L6R29_16345 [Myxococcota bacterium]|nr:hypothetical protein [Myxococcota bacterium]